MRYLLLPISSIHVPPFWHGEDLHSLTVLTEQLAPLVPSGQTQRQEATSSGTDTPPFSQVQVVYWQESPGLKSYKTFYPELFKIFNVKSKLGMGPQDYYFILSKEHPPNSIINFHSMWFHQFNRNMDRVLWKCQASFKTGTMKHTGFLSS